MVENTGETAGETTAQAPIGETAASEAEIRAKLDAPFELRVRSQNGRYQAGIPELGLVATGKDLAALEAELRQARESRIREYAAEGILDWVPAPGAAQGAGEAKKSLLSQLKVFLIKAAVATALFLGAVNIISGGLRDIGYVLEKKLDSVTAMTPESVEMHRAKAAKIAEKLGPIVREVLVIFDRAPAARPDVPADNATAKP